MDQSQDFQTFQLMMLASGTPAFARRAKEVELSWEHLLETCEQKRKSLLEMSRMRLAYFLALLRSWPNATSKICSAEDLAYLETLEKEWSPRLRIESPRARSLRAIKHSLIELRESFERFNQRWNDYIRHIDLLPINKLREGYNKNYVIEKECAVWSPAVARGKFFPLPPVSHQELLDQFPILKIPNVF